MEAKEMECLKILNLGWCEERTYENGPGNYSLCWNYAQRREWKFAQIRDYNYSGTMFTSMQGSYEMELKRWRA